MYEPLIPAQIVAGEGDVPFSPRFGDVYHSSAGALAQAQHVFLRGNGLPERWRGRAAFTVLETGFGMGLNFLALWRLWREDAAPCATLHMVSIEAHPLPAEQLAYWLRRLAPDDLRGQVEALLAQWPPLVPGLHRLEFADGAVTLTLAFGQAETVLPRLEVAADAFFLDGFAPQRNPQMWSAELLEQLAQRGVADASAATWATAGAMRRALTAAGFAVAKRPGFGGKREMTVARLERAGTVAEKVLRARRPVGRAAVIGTGLAGAGVAAALARRGWEVTAVAHAAPATSSGPGHVAAALTPLADPADSRRARLTRAGALRALHRWRSLMQPGGGAQAAVSQVGTVQVAKAARARTEEELARWQSRIAAMRYPPDWLRVIGEDEAAELAGQPVSRAGLYFPRGLLLRPEPLCVGLLAHPAIRCVAGHVARLRGLPGERWRLLDSAGATLADADLVVLANAAGAPALLRDSGLAWPLGERMEAVAGQISVLPASALTGQGPACIVAGEGYVLPRVDGYCVAGSTYDHDASPDAPLPLSAEAHAANLARLRNLLPIALQKPPPPVLQGWAGWRAVLPGRMPAIGALQEAPGIWLATAYASRGSAWSALAGDVIGAALQGEPPVLEEDLLREISPQRG